MFGFAVASEKKIIYPACRLYFHCCHKSIFLGRANSTVHSDDSSGHRIGGHSRTVACIRKELCHDYDKADKPVISEASEQSFNLRSHYFHMSYFS